MTRTKQTLTERAVAGLAVDAAGRLRGPVAVDLPDDSTGEESVLALIKSVPGSVSLESMLTEIRKLRAVRAFGLPAGLFADVAPAGGDRLAGRASEESGIAPARPLRADPRRSLRRGQARHERSARTRRTRAAHVARRLRAVVGRSGSDGPGVRVPS